MYISEIFASGFRCFSADSPLNLSLQAGLNILVGPNDAGKTAIVDAPRHVLWTRGDDFVRLDAADFHVKPNGERASELLIRCSFDGLLPTERARFLEWCTNEAGHLRLHVCLRAALRSLPGGGTIVTTQYRAGKDGDGPALEGDLREYLKATYLRPLRDAERELRSGRRSRLSRILGAMPAMAAQSKPAEGGAAPTLVDVLGAADQSVNSNAGVGSIQRSVNTTYLDKLSFADDLLSATLGLGAKGSFEQILERLELYLNPKPGHTERTNRGLGYNNLLFMAAELLLLQSHPEHVSFLLIEEPEAHLHPQHQSLFMQVLQDRASSPNAAEPARKQVQVLLTTHSPGLAASADIESMVMVVGHKIFPLRAGQTALAADDYSFLRRFLDATKANLFFARGVIVVEGDAENLLIPAVAKKLGRPLGKYGVSIVNVGHVGLFRYSRILRRPNGTPMPIPVALIPDRDIPPDAAKALVGDRRTEGDWEQEQLTSRMQRLRREDGQNVQSFPSVQWTLEFDLARQPALAPLVAQAIALAKEAAGQTRDQIKAAAATEVARLQALPGSTADGVAAAIYQPLYNRVVSKAETAEQLSWLIEELPDDPATFEAKCPAYLVAAIRHATQGVTVEAAQAGGAGAGRVAAQA